MGSYHSDHRLHLGLDHTALGWRQMGSCPVSDRNMFNTETFQAHQCRQCNVKDMYQSNHLKMCGSSPPSTWTLRHCLELYTTDCFIQNLSMLVFKIFLKEICYLFVQSRLPLNRTLNHTYKTKGALSTDIIPIIVTAGRPVHASTLPTVLCINKHCIGVEKVFLTHPIIRDPIIVIIIITSIPNSIFVIVLLPRVGKARAVVLKDWI